MSAFAGLRNGQVFENGNYLTPGGLYAVEIQRCMVKKTRKGKTGLLVEFVVLESSSEKHLVGSKATWFQDLNADGGFGAIKLFVYALMGHEYAAKKDWLIANIDPGIEALMDKAVEGNGDALKGSKLRCETVGKKTKENRDFTQHHWSPYAKAT